MLWKMVVGRDVVWKARWIVESLRERHQLSPIKEKYRLGFAAGVGFFIGCCFTS